MKNKIKEKCVCMKTNEHRIVWVIQHTNKDGDDGDIINIKLLGRLILNFDGEALMWWCDGGGGDTALSIEVVGFASYRAIKALDIRFGNQTKFLLSRDNSWNKFGKMKLMVRNEKKTKTKKSIWKDLCLKWLLVSRRIYLLIWFSILLCFADLHVRLGSHHHGWPLAK